MNAHQVIAALGGRKEVMRITGLSKGRISQWAGENAIPRSWMVAFRALKPKQIPEAAIDELDASLRTSREGRSQQEHANA